MKDNIQNIAECGRIKLSGSTDNSRTKDDPVVYFTTKTFEKTLQSAFLAGGKARKRSDRARIVLGSLSDPDPFITLKLTNHGETRIDNCLKYDLGDAWRLVTRQTEKTCTFLYIGDHEDTERWLEAHKGETIGVKDRRLIRVPGTATEFQERRVSVEQHHEPLVDMLHVDSSNHLLEQLPPDLVRKLGRIDGTCNSEELNIAIAPILDPTKRELIQKVFCLLLEGNVDGAQAHVDLSMGRIAPVEEYDPDDILEILDGEDVRQIKVGSVEYENWIRAFELRSSWHEWFLFLHPEQETIVNSDYPGPSQLSGVSGSGKTCVTVRRAIRLAISLNSKVLLLTLNRSLAGMLQQLVDAACLDIEVRNRIEVTSFFELAQKLLNEFEPHNIRAYADVTWKLDEHVDEIFREYYRCWANNHDASVLLPLHKSLNSRGVSGEMYIRQEFDWIRSADQPKERNRYLTIERKGRKFPITADRRNDLVLGLDGWERKMRDVGVIDYLGLTAALSTHTEQIKHRYTNILVDEAQDFGTTELSIVRLLVPPGDNDIFLCGDIAQTILPKHRSLTECGIHSPARERIRRNYRNSREILTAAYDLLKLNLHDDLFESSDLEILDPTLANFSDASPLALSANSLEEEISYARSYARTRLSMGARNLCIAFAGYSSRDIKGFAEECGVTALDGAYDPNTDHLVFSDLEQTKGYEFDVIIVVNCCEHILPARDAPQEEAYRDICKLYVAMTRAKRELIMSFHGAASTWITAVGTSIAVDDWENVENIDDTFVSGIPKVLSETDPNIQNSDEMSLTGVQFLYTGRALGLTAEAQEKLCEVVDGKGLVRGGSGRRLKWSSVGALAKDLNESRTYDGLLGPNTADEIRATLEHK